MAKNADTHYGWGPDSSTSLHDKLKEDLKNALRNKDLEIKSTIRQIMAEFPKLTVPITLQSGKKTTRIKRPQEITNDDIVGIIQALVKSEKTVLEAVKQDTSAYLQILESYLPQTVSPEEIIDWIKTNIDFDQYKNKMQAMRPIMEHFGRQADGKQVNQILREWK